MEKIKINCPEGYEVDKEKSTFEEIVFKPSTKEAYDEQNKPKFEVGKWYKFNNCWYAKISNDWCCREGIDTHGIYQKTNYQTSIEEQPYKLLADLSEIQQYLPDGHEDKIIKYTLEEGEYYKVVEDDFWMIGKVVLEGIEESSWDKDDKSIDLRCNICPIISSIGEFHKHLDDWCYYSECDGKVTRNFTKLSKDSDEVKWLEACNKAGKYLTKEEALKSKLPTKWEDLDDYSGYYTHGNNISYTKDKVHFSGSDNWPTREYAKASIALCKLIKLRDIYNDGWIADWSDSVSKYTIYYYNGVIKTDTCSNIQRILHFKSKDLRDEFLKNFKDLIEEAEPLL